MSAASAQAFDPGAAVWEGDEDTWLRLLCDAPLEPLGVVGEASNHTLLCRLGDDEHYAIYKPRLGERPLWDFARGSLAGREVAAYAVSAELGWALVPPTVLRDGPAGVGSVQAFVPHDPSEHYFTLVACEEQQAPLTRLALFDLVTNNADRKGSHVLRCLADDRLYAIDNGLSFHPEPKLRTVVWDLGGAAVPASWRDDLADLAAALDRPATPVRMRLDPLLAQTEIRVLARRARRVAQVASLPAVPESRRPYPWPPL